MNDQKPYGAGGVVHGVDTEEERAEFMRNLRGFHGVVYFEPPPTPAKRWWNRIKQFFGIKT